MKKILCAAVMGLCLVSAQASAQRAISVGENRHTDDCSYTPLQEIIRDARSEADLAPITKNNVNLNVPVKCGGTVLQLAVLRGNPQVVRALLEAGADVTTPVSLEGFTIAGAPKEIPILHFAGFYSPRQDIVNLIISAGADVTAADANGESVLWYINQNPVLRNTALSDSIRNTLLFAPKNMEGEGARRDETGSTLGTARGGATANEKAVMRKVIDPRTPTVAPGQAIITKTGKDTIGQVSKDTSSAGSLPQGGTNTGQLQKVNTGGQLPQGMRIISAGSAFPTREIVEPDMPVKD